MGEYLIVVILAAGGIGLFVIGMSITLIFKGHHIKSEISDNENMRKLGIQCVLKDENKTSSDDCLPSVACEDDSCSACSVKR